MKEKSSEGIVSREKLVFFQKHLNNYLETKGVFELDLGDSEIPLTPKQEKEQKLLEEQLEMKTNETKQTK